MFVKIQIPELYSRLTQQEPLGQKPWNRLLSPALHVILTHHSLFLLYSWLKDPSVFLLAEILHVLQLLLLRLWFSGLSKHGKKYNSLAGRVYEYHIKINTNISKLSKMMMSL